MPTNCPICPEVCRNDKALQKHMAATHPHCLTPSGFVKPEILKTLAEGGSVPPRPQPPPLEIPEEPQPQEEPPARKAPQYVCQRCQKDCGSPRGLGQHKRHCGIQEEPVNGSDDLQGDATAMRRRAAECRSEAAKLLEKARRLEAAADILSQ